MPGSLVQRRFSPFLDLSQARAPSAAGQEMAERSKMTPRRVASVRDAGEGTLGKPLVEREFPEERAGRPALAPLRLCLLPAPRLSGDSSDPLYTAWKMQVTGLARESFNRSLTRACGERRQTDSKS